MLVMTPRLLDPVKTAYDGSLSTTAELQARVKASELGPDSYDAAAGVTAWSASNSYAIGDLVSVTDAGFNSRVYRCMVPTGPTTNKPFTRIQGTLTGGEWIVEGFLNKWKMLDYNHPSDPTLGIGSITVKILKTQGIELTGAVVLFNLVGVDVTVSVKNADETITYSTTTRELDHTFIYDWLMHFYEPSRRYNRLAILGDTPGEVVVVTVRGNPGDLVSCGAILMPGNSTNTFIMTGDLEASGPQEGFQVGIIDYSKKVVDTFGVTTLVKRKFSQTFTGRFICSTDYQQISAYLNSIRATVAAWLPVLDGDAEGYYAGVAPTLPDFSSAMLLGFYRDYRVIAQYPEHMLIELDVESIT